MTEETVSTQTEPACRPLIGIVFCYLAGILAGVWIDGFHFIILWTFALLALGAAFGLHCINRLLLINSTDCPALAGAVAGGGDPGPASPRPATVVSFSGTNFNFPFLPGPASCFVYLAVFLGGWMAVNLCLKSPSGRELYALMDRPREGVEIIGVVVNDPALYESRGGERQFWSFKMRVEAINRIGIFQNARGEILVTMPQNESEASRGPDSKPARARPGRSGRCNHYIRRLTDYAGRVMAETSRTLPKPKRRLSPGIDC